MIEWRHKDDNEHPAKVRPEINRYPIKSRAGVGVTGQPHQMDRTPMSYFKQRSTLENWE